MPVHILEIENFKSYGGVHRVGPFTNFTCVIGPNGSGKSNLMDAISFVLGVQSKALRSEQLQDLIYRQPGKKLSKKRFGASVTLHYRVSPNEEFNYQDDSKTDDDATTPSVSRRRRRHSASLKSSDDEEEDDDDDTEAEEGRLLRFGRSISPSGVGEYHLNGTRITWTEYEKELGKLGVLVQARNFLVFQGDVEALARKTPTQLVQLVDVLSGSAQYQKDYEQAQTDQQEKQQATVLHWQTQKALRQERKLLKQQKLEADRFQQLQQQKRDLQTQFYLWQLYRIQQDIMERQEQLTTAQEHLDELLEGQQKAVEKVQAAKKALSTLRRQLGQRQDDDLMRITSILDSKEPALAAIKSEQQDLIKKLQKDEKALLKEQKKADSQKQDLEALVEDMSKTQADLQVLEEEYERIKEEATRVKWTAAQEEEYEQVKHQAKTASARHVTKLQQLLQKLATARTKATNTERNLEQAQTKLAALQEETKSLQERRDKLTKTLDATKEESKKTDSTLVREQKNQRERSHRKQELDLALEEIQAQLRDAKAVLHKNRDEEKLLQTVKNLKTFTSTGVYGRLADLCRPVHKQFNLAVTVAAGKDMDAIVVDTPQTAQTCIQYLREQRIGTSTFLPLSQLQVPTHESTQHLRAMIEQDSRFRLALDVITVSDEYPGVDLYKAVQYSVGNTVVSDDLPGARELCFRRNQRIKAVTLQGAVISKAGTMTGGTTNDDKSKARWKNVEVEKLQARYEELSQERMSLDQVDSQPQQDLQDLQNKLGSLRNKQQFVQTDLEYSEQQFQEKTALVKNLEKQIQSMQSELTKANSVVEGMEKEVESARQAVVAAEEEFFQPFRERTGLTDLKAYDEAMGKSREEFQENKRVLLDHIAALQQKKAYEEARDVKKPIERIEQNMAERQAALEAAKSKQETLEKEIQSAKQELEKAQETVRKLEEQENEIVAQVKEAQKELDEARNESKNANKAVAQQETALERLRGTLHETLQKARVEEVELPMKNAEEDDDEEEEGGDKKGGQRRRTRLQKSSSSRKSRSEEGIEEEKSEDSEPSSGQISGSGTMSFTQESGKSRTHFSQAENAVVVRDREKASQVDFSSLPKSLKQSLSDREERKTRKDFDDNLAKIAADIEAMTPNMKAAEAFDACTEKLKDSSTDYEKAKSDAAKAAQEFERIKTKRSQLFSEAFEKIDQSLKTIYTDMTKSSKHPLGGNAYLSLDDTEEPYKGGLKFNAMPPMKRFRDMEHLSGGEKTVAALSLLFAIHSYRPAPFFIMDEIDAALDNINLRKVCNYIRRRSHADFQCIVISLKDMFYEQADALVGICRDAGTNSSRTLMLDLTKFDAKTLNTTADSASPRKRHSSASTTSPSQAESPSKRQTRETSAMSHSLADSSGLRRSTTSGFSKSLADSSNLGQSAESSHSPAESSTGPSQSPEESAPRRRRSAASETSKSSAGPSGKRRRSARTAASRSLSLSRSRRREVTDEGSVSESSNEGKDDDGSE